MKFKDTNRGNKFNNQELDNDPYDRKNERRKKFDKKRGKKKDYRNESDESDEEYQDW